MMRRPGDMLELCCECGLPTGRAGAGEDSLYADDGSGPYCEACWPGPGHACCSCDNGKVWRDVTPNDPQWCAIDMDRVWEPCTCACHEMAGPRYRVGARGIACCVFDGEELIARARSEKLAEFIVATLNEHEDQNQ